MDVETVEISNGIELRVMDVETVEISNGISLG